MIKWPWQIRFRRIKDKIGSQYTRSLVLWNILVLNSPFSFFLGERFLELILLLHRKLLWEKGFCEDETSSGDWAFKVTSKNKDEPSFCVWCWYSTEDKVDSQFRQVQKWNITNHLLYTERYLSRTKMLIPELKK